MKRSLRYWLKEILILVILAIAISVAMDWFRSQSLLTESAPPITVSLRMESRWMIASYEQPVRFISGRLGVLRVSLSAQQLTG